ncbi:DUF2489 domain-containing protein [Crocosphaera chwakensis]|uniref:DUF2489 domain-containing protein n=1 Tax=Crocosphaera chwakensis CCY0110 TaxID=391612 RepID=A3ISQ6_9CHRO|nr:DUF2489 domain-containing protein [Crocosphaera chwakensis]EAZ90476.1 hypothetical protein CY0110_26652 [Crocosphaera chwakensis CCY0110]
MQNYNTPKQLNQIKSEIIETAKKMIENKIDLIEGCRRIDDLKYELDFRDQSLDTDDDFDDAFLTFKGVTSETDDIPIGEAMRNTWHPDSLARLDVKKEEYLAKVKNRILDDCRQIIDILL